MMSNKLIQRLRVRNVVGLLFIQDQSGAHSRIPGMLRHQWSVNELFINGFLSRSCCTAAAARNPIYRDSRIPLRHLPNNSYTNFIISLNNKQSYFSISERHFSSAGSKTQPRPDFNEGFEADTKSTSSETLKDVIRSDDQIHSKSVKQPGDPATSDRSVEQAVEETSAKSQGGIFQRFKDAYREYGKVLIGVHVATSAVWFSAFFYAAHSGLDVIPLLEKLGASDILLKPFRVPGVGDAAVAYLLYKLATPARYAVTIGGTQLTVRALRSRGIMEPVPEGQSIREFVKEGRSQMKDKYGDMKDDVKDKYTDLKDDVKDKYTDLKGDVKDKYSDLKGDVKDKYSDLKGDVKDKYSEVKGEMRDKLKKG